MKCPLLRQHALIAGEATISTRTLAVDDPATGEVIGHAPDLGVVETERAIQAAHDAFGDWSRSDPHRRAAFLRDWAGLIDENVEGLGALIALENGKPFEEAKGEVAYANGFIKWFAGEAERLIGETQDSPLGHLILTFREAVGPCALITPWNFPAAMLARKLGPALAAGCTAVVKPASLTPFTAVALAELADRAGLPKGVLNVVTGTGAEAGAALDGIAPMRVNCFGHLGDGNLHYNLFPAQGKSSSDYKDLRDKVKVLVHDMVHARGGSVSAEHGIGRLKVGDLERYGDPARLAAMRAIKAALDPLGIMNPGAVLRP